MQLRVHTNQLAIRVLGTLMGTGFLVVGSYAMFGADALWFGITAWIGGAWAIGVSWLDSDLSGVWCRPPRRPGDLRNRSPARRR
jgi:hypothetical protein